MITRRAQTRISNFIADVLPMAVLRYLMPRTFIVYGHLVSNLNHPVAAYYRYPTVSEFETLLEKLSAMGYKYVSLPEYITKDGRKKILLTFDDGFKSVYEELHPLLKKKEIPYAVFVLTDPIDNEKFYIETVKPKNDVTGERLFLCEREIQDLKEQGVHIGFHTQNHLRLGEEHLENENAFEKLQIPAQYAKLFSNPLCFSYPYRAPDNFKAFNAKLKERFQFKFFFDTKGFKDNIDDHFFRVSIDADKSTTGKHWIIRNLKRQLMPRIKRNATRAISTYRNTDLH